MKSSPYAEKMVQRSPSVEEILEAVKKLDGDIFPAQALVNGEWYLSSYQVATVLELALENQKKKWSVNHGSIF